MQKARAVRGQDLCCLMSNPAEKPEVVQLPAEQPIAAPVNTRRAAAQRVREARDRLTSTSGTRPAFDTELLRQYAQTRMSASYVVMLLVVAVSSMLAASLPIAALAATAPVTAAIALNFILSGSFDNYALALLAIAAEGYFALLAHRLHSTTLATLEARAEKDALIG